MTFAVDRWVPLVPRLLGRYGLYLALVAALLLRLGMAAYVGWNAPPERSVGGADVVELEHMAWTLSEGRGMRNPSDALSAFRAPGYPFMLGTLYAIFGHHYFLNRLLLISLSVSTCCLVFPLARAMGLSRPVSALSTLICAGLPLQIYYPSRFFSEPAATFFNTLSVLFLAWGTNASKLEREHWWWVAFAGLLNGASIAVRPISLLMIPAVPVVMFITHPKRWRRALAVGLVFGITSTLLVAPCTIRNFRLFRGLALVSTNGGSTLWGSNNTLVADPANPNWGYWISTNFDLQTKQREVMLLDNELLRDKAEFVLGVRFWLEHPGQVPMLLVGKFVRLLNPLPISNNRLFRYGVGLAALILTPLSLLGLYVVCIDVDARQTFAPLLASLLVLIATTAIFYGSERFRSPLEPQQSVFAAIGLAWLTHRVFLSGRTRMPPAVKED